MEYSYEILVAEPLHKALCVKYFKEGKADYYKNFIVEDWSNSSTVTSLITGFAPFVIEYWGYQDSAPDTSPLAVGHIGTATSEAYSAPEETVSVADQQRMKRDYLLQQTDWMVFSDTATPSQAWLDYRQALRDVPSQAGFPDSVTWPTKPE